MSVKLMSAIFETEFRDLQDNEGNTTKAATAKLVLLALADHANDEGESAYPSVDRLAKKTALSSQTIRNTFDALKHNGIVMLTGTSKYMTNNYTINTKSFPRLQGNQDEFPPLNLLDPSNGYFNPSNGSLQPLNPLDPNHHININKHGDKSPMKTDELPIEWQIAAGAEKVVQQDDLHNRRVDFANLVSMQTSNPPMAFAIAMAFQEQRGIVLPESKAKGQRKAIREMLEMGVTGDNVRRATKELMEKKMTVVDLFSVSKTAQDIANKPAEFVEYTRLL
jgi:hypothetical protein